MALDCNLYPGWAQNVCFWLILQEILDFFWDLGLMLFDIPEDVAFPEILVLSNIFGFPTVNWAPKWTKTVNLHAFHLSQNSNFWRISQTMCLPYWKTTSSKLTPDIYLNKVFHLRKSWGVKMSLKISFLDQFRSFLNTAIKIVAYLIHHLDVITGQKFKKNWKF